MGSNDQPGPEDVALGEPRGLSLISSALQAIHPPDRVESQSDMPRLTRTRRKRPLLPDQMLLNSYLPSRGPTPAMEEVEMPGQKDMKHIIRRWEPFNQGESAADCLDNLYPIMLRMPVSARAGGLGEEYSVAIPVGVVKEDLQ